MDAHNELNYWKNKYEKLEKENERLEKTLEAWFMEKKIHDRHVDELLAQKNHQDDYIQKIEDENAQLRAEALSDREPAPTGWTHQPSYVKGE